MGGAAVRRCLIVLAMSVAYLLSGGCSTSCKDMGFSSFEKADRIVVKKMSKDVIATITDRSRIVEIARFVETQGKNWTAPIAGTPIGSISLEFYAAGQFLGDLGIGKGFLEAQGCGHFFSRPLSKENLHEIVRQIGVPEALVR
jgi:hypothetical protein